MNHKGYQPTKGNLNLVSPQDGLGEPKKTKIKVYLYGKEIRAEDVNICFNHYFDNQDNEIIIKIDTK